MRATDRSGASSIVTVGLLITACMVIALSVAAVVGAVTYAGWIEPGSDRYCECDEP